MFFSFSFSFFWILQNHTCKNTQLYLIIPYSVVTHATALFQAGNDSDCCPSVWVVDIHANSSSVIKQSRIVLVTHTHTHTCMNAHVCNLFILRPSVMPVCFRLLAVTALKCLHHCIMYSLSFLLNALRLVYCHSFFFIMGICVFNFINPL
jgi:hypothetical protein